MAPYEALYGRKCKSPLCWSDISESLTLGPEMIDETTKQVRLIQENMKAAQDRQKSYADQNRRIVEFEFGEKALLKVSPTKGVMRFGRKGKLNPRYIGPYEVLKRVREVAYQLALPMELANVHNVFHVSQLRKYVHDPTHVIQPESIELDETLTFEERPVKILDTKTRSTRNKAVKLVKVLWSNQNSEEATWEAEHDMKKRYPELFDQRIRLEDSWIMNLIFYSSAYVIFDLEKLSQDDEDSAVKLVNLLKNHVENYLKKLPRSEASMEVKLKGALEVFE
ncbi:uncharacterized protein LOC110697537 [Chenopodium quinoa]|uniref:uncharacterized protein LOC110697537 n=1 Tax=Chenopodium quinoa TaxID=63459 RepID=UPI000B793CF8|nr:uncharacterized protein LOC110697537 [Chenopodium quinoa]